MLSVISTLDLVIYKLVLRDCLDLKPPHSIIKESVATNYLLKCEAIF